MMVDGKAIAHELKEKLRDQVDALRHPLKLAVIVLSDAPEMQKFVALKQQCGADIGVEVTVYDEYRETKGSTEQLLRNLLRITRECDGVVLQLPIPKGYNTEHIYKLFPLSHDVDVIGTMAYQQFKEHTLPFLPPVVGAFQEVLFRHGVGLAGRRVLVVGEGRLVGAPAAIWAHQRGATVVVANKHTSNLDVIAHGADIIILGAGAPGLLTPDMVREGAYILDAGTSEESGVLKGDADPACAEKVALFTPTPGGIGPITVVKLFENLVTLHKLKQKQHKK